MTNANGGRAASRMAKGTAGKALVTQQASPLGFSSHTLTTTPLPPRWVSQPPGTAGASLLPEDREGGGLRSPQKLLLSPARAEERQMERQSFMSLEEKEEREVYPVTWEPQRWAPLNAHRKPHVGGWSQEQKPLSQAASAALRFLFFPSAPTSDSSKIKRPI